MYVMSDNGIFKKASDAKLKTDIASWQERLELAKEPVFINGLGTFDADEYFEYIEEQEYIEDKDTDVTDNEDGSYLVTTKPGHIFQIELVPSKENPKDIQIEYIGEAGKLFPKINSIEVTSKNSNSITVKVTVSRLNNGTLSYYYKKEEETEYHELEGKQNTEDLTAEYTGLEQNKIYNIKVVVENKVGTDEAVINELTRELAVGIISQKGETTWSNEKASIELETTPPDLRLEYQVNGIEGTWLSYNGPIGNLNHKDTVYARITDGVNSGEAASIEVRDEEAPSNASITLGATNANTGANVTAKVTHNDAQSGIRIASCKWVYNTTSGKIGTAASSYTGGTFSSNGQTINLNASTPGTYYLHVLSVDNAGNALETVSGAVTVKQLATGISVSPTSATVTVGATKQLSALVTPSNTSNKGVTWTSSNTGVATVNSSGLVTAKAAGNATITVKTSDGSNKSATCSITVQQLATGISVSPTPTTVEKGKTRQLTATVTPSNTSNKGVTWTSSNTGIATVNSSGVVTGVKAGNVTITVKTADGSNKSATCSITVQDPTPVTIGSDDASWATMNRIATAIAKDSSINSSSTKATGYTANGERYEISVGGIYKVKYNGEERRVRVLGFKHDDLINTGAYGGNHSKASISFEFLDFMIGSTSKSMNSSDTNSGGWRETQLRKDLNGYTTSNSIQNGAIGGLGANLNNKSYIKQVKKKYIATHNNASSVTTCNDYLWLLASSEVVNSGYQSGAYGVAITSEGSQYKYYQGVTEAYNVSSANRVKRMASSGSENYWGLRSPRSGYSDKFCGVSIDGRVNNGVGANIRMDVTPGFCI